VAGEFIVSPRTPRTWLQLLKGKFLSLFGITEYVYQKVAHSRPWSQCPHRLLVWTIPQYSVCQFNWIRTDLRARTLKRMKFADVNKPGWNILVYPQNEELWVSFGRNGQDAHAEISKADFDVLMGLISAQSVTTRAIGMNYKGSKILAQIAQYFTGNNPALADPARLTRSVVPKPHWPLSSEQDAPEITTRSYASPLIADCNYVPQKKRWETLSASLEHRVTFTHNGVVPRTQYQQYADEFVKLVVPLAGLGDPYSWEDTAELLNKPSQILAVKQVWETVDAQPRKLIEAFVKDEPCMKTGRIISSFADCRLLLSLSRYTLAFRDTVLHTEENRIWFCPGMTPTEIAAKVHEYVSMVEEPLEGDYSNFDGKVSAWMQRHVMNAVYRRHFRRDYANELDELLEMLIRCPARAKRFQFHYDAGVGVKSGSPTTCDLNTVANAFVQFCAIRLTKYELPPELAFRMIGLCFGDDSLFSAEFKGAYDKAARALGMDLKLEKFKAEEGVVFLARVFPDPWTTCTSFQDPLRTWRKLHLTSRDPNVPLADAATDRLEGYLVTDALTPLTAEYARFVVNCYSSSSNTEERRRERRSVDREKPYWYFHEGTWPQFEDDVDLMLNCIVARTGIDKAKILERIAYFRQSETPDPWFAAPIDRELEADPGQYTLGEDGLPVGEVDDRTLEKERNAATTRANPGAAALHPRTDGTPQDRPEQVRRGGGVQRSGRGRNDGLPDSSRRQNEPRHNRPDEQAARPRRSDRSQPNESHADRPGSSAPHGGRGNSGGGKQGNRLHG
jgi:hypothetical protein